MADSETKARKKLEEAEKKMKGGGGFLGKLFGGGGSDEAADLFIQNKTNCSSDDEDEEQDDNASSITCLEKGCGYIFEDDDALLEHCQSFHTNQCAFCEKSFSSSYSLEVHSDENHCPFFKLRLERDSSSLHYRCLEKTCDSVFGTPTQRDEHSISHCDIPKGLLLPKRKMDRRLEKMNAELSTSSISSASKESSNRIRFGEEQELSFESKRVLAKPWNKRGIHVKKQDNE